MNILCIGLLSTTFLLITKDFYVFELPLDAIKGMGNSTEIFLGAVQPMHLGLKWPKLAASGQFRRIQSHIYSSFTLRDDESEYVLFLSKRSNEGGTLRGVTYDLVRERIIEGITFNDQKSQILISASERRLFYGLQNGDDQKTLVDLQVSEFPLPKGQFTAKTNVSLPSQWKRLCADSLMSLHLSSDNSSQCAQPVKWGHTLLAGFIARQQVFLFGTLGIYMFELTAFTNPDVVVSVAVKHYDTLFACHQDNLRWAIVLLVVLMILLLLLLLIWLFCCQKKRQQGTTTPAGTAVHTSSAKKASRSVKSKKPSSALKSSAAKSKGGRPFHSPKKARSSKTRGKGNDTFHITHKRDLVP